MKRPLVVLALVALVVSGCGSGEVSPLTSSAPNAGLADFYGQQPDWRDCGDDFECAQVEVPLDYDQPSGDRIGISVIRLAATGDRIGSLLLNPGGPGGSGIEYTRAARVQVSEAVRDRFDIVGFDPRGVGESTPVTCMSGGDLDAYLGLDMSPDSVAETRAMEAGSRDFAQRCHEKSAELLPHVGTADAARDMDVLRAVLGDEGLTYLGKSYGTYLGATYADLFPKKVRALVLDGAVDPAVSALKMNEIQSKGFEVALTAFIEDCLEASDCPFRSKTAEGALNEITNLLRRADQQPLRNTLGDGRAINDTWLAFGIATPLYDKNSWKALREALRTAFQGDGTYLLRFADILLGRREDGTYSNQTEANKAVNCVDHVYPADTPDFDQAAAKAGKLAPRFGEFVMWDSLPCAYWPAKGPDPDRKLTASGAPPIVVVGTLRDPATPYEWAEGLASQLTSGVLLTYDGDGHTAYMTGSTCIDTAVDDYLINLKPPTEGTRC
ncbi:proteinase [Acrocarpospora corrugata]|uniref:Proteinase n=1 Tax=Acrocarpospora corrugata TaxID=35763 RepID=A0A5M3WAL8_9ACTN|nr:alpha/beta hydrolase [Acrocarpospora corrugata]GES05419.1 proteinase [Acrocarpospora corrugata]